MVERMIRCKLHCVASWAFRNLHSRAVWIHSLRVVSYDIRFTYIEWVHVFCCTGTFKIRWTVAKFTWMALQLFSNQSNALATFAFRQFSGQKLYLFRIVRPTRSWTSGDRCLNVGRFNWIDRLGTIEQWKWIKNMPETWKPSSIIKLWWLKLTPSERFHDWRFTILLWNLKF